MIDNFDSNLQQLGMLAFDLGKVDKFTDLYQKMLEDVYNEMMNPENISLLADGTYLERGKVLKGMLAEEIKFLGGKVPKRKIDA